MGSRWRGEKKGVKNVEAEETGGKNRAVSTEAAGVCGDWHGEEKIERAGGLGREEVGRGGGGGERKKDSKRRYEGEAKSGGGAVKEAGEKSRARERRRDNKGKRTRASRGEAEKRVKADEDGKSRERRVEHRAGVRRNGTQPRDEEERDRQTHKAGVDGRPGDEVGRETAKTRRVEKRDRNGKGEERER